MQAVSQCFTSTVALMIDDNVVGASVFTARCPSAMASLFARV